jgi:hypothetical protein
MFDDGTRATLETPGFRPPLNDGRVLLMLKQIPAGVEHTAQSVITYAGGLPLFRTATFGGGVYDLALDDEGKLRKSRTLKTTLEANPRKNRQSLR